MQRTVNFDNSEIAFQHKNNRELQRAYLVFKLLNNNTANNFLTWFAGLALRLKLPIAPLFKITAFPLFCGGTSIEDCQDTISMLKKYGVCTNLDYALEGKNREEDFERTLREAIKIIHYSGQHPEVDSLSIKPTSITDYRLLEKLNNNTPLSEKEAKGLDKLRSRLHQICELAVQKNCKVLIDAEESWLQNGIDRLMTELMKKYNKEKAIVFNTVQLYRHDRIAFLKAAIADAISEGYFYGIKLVRGAYLEKENERAEKLGYPTPMHSTKAATDKDYNEAIRICIQHIEQVSFIAATHNEESSLLLVQLMEDQRIDRQHPHVLFAQLYGMSNHISFNLAAAGYRVSKYLPYGPVKDVIPYLVRRAEENTAIAGQMSRELKLIRKEIRKRRL